jgi:hypothetical protein
MPLLIIVGASDPFVLRRHASEVVEDESPEVLKLRAGRLTSNDGVTGSRDLLKQSRDDIRPKNPRSPSSPSTFSKDFSSGDVDD